jgi:hypothetical protein
MSNTRSVNLESNNVVQEKGRVVMKALSELISTKYKVAIKTNEKEEVLYKMSEVIANKGINTQPVQQQVVVVNTLAPTTKSETIRRVREGMS